VSFPTAVRPARLRPDASRAKHGRAGDLACMIELEAAGKRFGGGPRDGGVEALRELTLSIGDGGITAVVGPNGAGKTTLFGLILGFLTPTGGRVRVAGLPPRRYARSIGAGYMPERFGLPRRWTVRGALRALARMDGAGQDAMVRADRAMTDFGLDGFAARRVGTLSRGMLQRLGLAQAFMGGHPLLVLDEPAQGLDPLWRIRLRELLRSSVAGPGAGSAAGRTILLASHDLTEVERLADRAILLEAGRLKEVLELQRPTARQQYRLALAAGGEHVSSAFPGAVAVSGRKGGREGERGGGGGILGEGTGEGNAFLVTVADAAELSERLAALLAAGAVVSEVTPSPEPLEGRVRRILEEDGP
jgi:ABC-type multidrug transport system ATPase subunit